MLKEWFVIIGGKKEGPYSAKDLLNYPEVQLDSLVWKEGFEEWLPLYQVPELRELFKYREEEASQFNVDPSKELLTEEEGVLVNTQDPTPFFLWLLLFLLIFLFFFYTMSNK